MNIHESIWYLAYRSIVLFVYHDIFFKVEASLCLKSVLHSKIYDAQITTLQVFCFYYQTCLVRLHSYFFNASQGLVMYVLRILWGKKRAISPFLQNSCIMGFALHKCRGRTGRTRVPKGHTACWVMHRIKYILSTLLYGYSLIIAKNFVTMYTAFDYWNRVNLL